MQSKTPPKTQPPRQEPPKRTYSRFGMIAIAMLFGLAGTSIGENTQIPMAAIVFAVIGFGCILLAAPAVSQVIVPNLVFGGILGGLGVVLIFGLPSNRDDDIE